MATPASNSRGKSTLNYGSGPQARARESFLARLATPRDGEGGSAYDALKNVRASKPKLEQGVAGLREIAAKDPQGARQLAAAGAATARAQALVSGISIGAALGSTTGACMTKCYWTPPPFYTSCPGSYWYPWGLGLGWYGSNYCFNLGFGGGWFWPNGGYACWGPSLSTCWGWGWTTSLCWSTWHAYKPWYYYDSPAVVYSTCYVPYYVPSYSAATSDATSYVASSTSVVSAPVDETAITDVPRGEVIEPATAAVAPRPRTEATKSYRINSAAQRFLDLGDAAFRAENYSDAVQHYARAVENAPDAGVLYLVLSDALFATRDWHYSAYALRRALALEPALADAAIDKHTFYANGAEFDRQLAVLELFVKDNQLDSDARLVLGANYLFGRRPQACVELLSAPAAAALRSDSTTGLLLEAAQQAQYGEVGDASPQASAAVTNSGAVR